MNRIFVYGTLKRGFPNHAALADARYIGQVRTREAYPLVVQGPWFTPAMLPEPGTGHRVWGELWEVDTVKFSELDDLESLNRPMGYERQFVMVEHADNTTERVWAYLKPRDRITVIHTEPLADYQDQRYIPASQRSR